MADANYSHIANFVTVKDYKIGAMCRMFGVTPRALRYYEACGLISPARRGIERIYTRGDYHRLRVIIACRQADLNLKQIKQVIDAYRPEDKGRAQAALTLTFLKEQAADLQERMQQLQEMIDTVAERAGVASEPATAALSSPHVMHD